MPGTAHVTQTTAEARTTQKRVQFFAPRGQVNDGSSCLCVLCCLGREGRRRGVFEAAQRRAEIGQHTRGTRTVLKPMSTSFAAAAMILSALASEMPLMSISAFFCEKATCGQAEQRR